MKYKYRISVAVLTLLLSCLKQPNTANAQNPSDKVLPAVLQSASELDYPPFCIVRPDGSTDGFSVELLRAVISEMRRKITFKVGPWNEIKQDLADGRIDVLPLVSYNAQRDAVYDFTVPYVTMHGAIFIRKDNTTIKGGEDLLGKEVIVMQGDTAHEYALKEQLTTKLIFTNSYAEAFTMLAEGTHDAILAQKLMGLQLIKQQGIDNISTVADQYPEETGLKPSSMTTSGFEQKFCFAVKEGNKTLLFQLNEALAIVFANGTYNRLYHEWFGPILPAPVVPMVKQVKTLLKVLLPILLILLTSGLVYLRREVASKTRHLRQEIEERKKAEEVKEQNYQKLQAAHEEIKTLRGILPFCSYCKKIRNDQGVWENIDKYIHTNSEADISHSICPQCAKQQYPEYYNKE